MTNSLERVNSCNVSCDVDAPTHLLRALPAKLGVCRRTVLRASLQDGLLVLTAKHWVRSKDAWACKVGLKVSRRFRQKGHTMDQYSPRSFWTGVPLRTIGVSGECVAGRTDSTAGAEGIKHLGSLVVLGLEAVALVTDNEANRRLAHGELLAVIVSYHSCPRNSHDLAELKEMSAPVHIMGRRTYSLIANDKNMEALVVSLEWVSRSYRQVTHERADLARVIVLNGQNTKVTREPDGSVESHGEPTICGIPSSSC